MKSKKILISVLICALLLTLLPLSATAATKKMTVTSNRVTEIHDGDSFKFKTSWSIVKPKFTFSFDSRVQGCEQKVIISIKAKGYSKTFCYDAASLARKNYTLEFPRKSQTYTVKITVKSDGGFNNKKELAFTAKHTAFQGSGKFYK